MSTLVLSEQGTPSTPSAGKRYVYLKADGFLYSKGADGVERSLAPPAPYLDFSEIAAPSYLKGRVWYDQATQALSVMDDVSGTSLQLGHELTLRARNNTGVQISNKQVVYITGATGQNPTIALAKADSISTVQIIGMATHDIANGEVGKITTFGLVNDVDTSAFADGATLFVSPTVAGGVTDVKPVGPVNVAAKVGVVTFAHAVNGKIFIHADAPFQRIGGWAAATGTATRSTFDTTTVTTAQLAERLKALIDDLITQCLIGT